MKHGTAINCIEFTGGNTYKAPPAADPNEANLNLEVKVYKLNPDGSKGELLRTDPAFPEGWGNPRAILPQRKKGVEEVKAREDRDEIVATAKKLMSEGKSMGKTAEILKVPLSTLSNWMGKESEEPKKNYFGTPIIEPKPENNLYVKIKEMAQQTVKMNYDQAVNQLALSFIFDIYDSDLAPVDKLGLIAKQIKVWEDL